ncbi:MAG: cysteate synthase [Bacteroidales bacterium]|nr:cysteate synthase [Bacteroidales bacterium]
MDNSFFEPTKYRLKTIASGRVFEDKGWMLNDPECNEPSLIRAVYEKRDIDIKGSEYGFYRFSDWLPISRILKDSSQTITYKSKGLSRKLRLPNLYISFSGYWPKIGAQMSTCSFKETEAYSVCARLPENCKKILVVASAGNTARAFAKVCSDNEIPLLICVPEDCAKALWFEKPLNKCVKMICVPKGSDYFDAIALSNKLCTSPIFIEEGGAKNIARRDGMGTTVLSAVETIGRIPDCYFQAIGSGTGTIAAWETNLRLIESGKYGTNKMKLFPSQNIPFTPMYDAWKASSRQLLPMDENLSREKALQIDAKVLSNRRPPYSLKGGLFDALSDAGGHIEIAGNEDIVPMQEFFRDQEGVDIHPAAAIALAGMIKTFDTGKMPREAVTMLNITGGGDYLFKKEHSIVYLKPSLILSPDDESAVAQAEKLFI